MWYTDAVPQWSYLILAGIGLVGAFVLLFIAMELFDSILLGIVGIAIGAAVMIYGLYVASSDNYHKVTEGTVIGTGYQPKQTTTTTQCTTANNITTCYPVTTTSDPYYWVQLRDEKGITGKLHFKNDQSKAHPVGSYYKEGK